MSHSAENRRPAFVVRARRQFGNIVGGRVGFEAADLAEIVHGVAGIAGAAADAENEQPPAAFAHAREFIGAFFNGIGVQLGGDLLDFVEKLLGETHNDFDCSSDSSSAKPAGDPIS